VVYIRNLSSEDLLASQEGFCSMELVGWLVGRSVGVKKTLGTPLTASQLLYCFINQIYERCPATAVKKLRVIVFVVTSVLFHIVWCPTKTKTKTLVSHLVK
jgi:hypothetical protein